MFLISYYYKNSCIHTTIYILLNAIAYFYFFISHIYTYCGKVQLFGKCIQLVQLFLCIHIALPAALKIESYYVLLKYMYIVSMLYKEVLFLNNKRKQHPIFQFFWQKSIFKSLKWSGSTTRLTGL